MELIKSWLHANGDYINSFRDAKGMTALHYATMHCKTEIVKVLLNQAGKCLYKGVGEPLCCYIIIDFTY